MVLDKIGMVAGFAAKTVKTVVTGVATTVVNEVKSIPEGVKKGYANNVKPKLVNNNTSEF